MQAYIAGAWLDSLTLESEIPVPGMGKGVRP